MRDLTWLISITLLTALGSCVPISPAVGGLGGPSHAITIHPATPSVQMGGTVKFWIEITHHDGSKSVGKAGDYKWSSSNPAIGAMDSLGQFSAFAPGQTEIAAIEKSDERVQDYTVATVTNGAASEP
jgi:Bacterial Ig-like domain (group 2)